MRISVLIKKFLYSFSCFFLLSVCLVCFSPNIVSAAEVNNPDVDEIYEAFMNQSKEEFLENLLNLSENSSDFESMLSAGYALLKRTDFTHEDYLSLISNPNNPVSLRHVAIECYAKKIPDSGVDDVIIDLISDSSVEPSLRTIAIALLHNNFDVQNEAHISALLLASDSENDEVAYNAIKALERIYPECAITIAQDIYNNFENESSARINIASKVLARHYSSYQFNSINQDELDRFIEKSLEIYNSIDNDEIRRVIPQALALLPSTYTKNYNLEDLNSVSKSGVKGFQGYAAYRDGVAEIEWHGAIIYGPETSTSYYIFAQASGNGHTTEYVSYLDFLDGNNQMGYYEPSSVSLTDSQRQKVIKTAKELVDEHIPYCLINIIEYDRVSSSQRTYTPSDISAIRCDGFVEYAYEYNNIRVCGGDSDWNISKVGDKYQDAHGGLTVTPKKQAKKYMDKIGSLV